jgi:hypothetical protein
MHEVYSPFAGVRTENGRATLVSPARFALIWD